MDFQRNVWSALVNWKEGDNRKPLILRGARQVGKTTLVRQLGKTYSYFIELNLEKREDKEIVEQSNHVQQLADSLSLLHKVPSKSHKKTLLFIDEVQESPKAIEFLRYFYEELSDIHVIAAGSLLEHSLNKIQHFPVGRVNYLYLFPLNFQEFLQAMGDDQLIERIRNLELDDFTHTLLLERFKTYCIIGGMPEIVLTYLKNKDITDLPSIYESIWNTYKEDVAKYATSKGEQKVIQHIMNTAAALVDKRVKFQNFGSSNYKSREVGEAFRSLDSAKVIQIIYPSTQVEPPLIPDKRKSPRLQLLDTGLLNFDLAIQANLLRIDDLSNAYKGAIIPHLIIQEVISLNRGSFYKPNFWVRDKTQASSEVDLVIQHKNLLIPIEIKSGISGTLKSLHQFVDRAPHHFAVRMYAGKFSIEANKTIAGKKYYLMNLPYYLGTFLEQYIDYFMNEVGNER